MDFKSFIGALRDLVDAAGQDVTDSPAPTVAPIAAPAPALPHSIDPVPAPSSTPAPAAASVPSPSPTPTQAAPAGSGAVPHSIDVPSIGNDEPILVGATITGTTALVVTPDPMPSDPATANFEQLIAPSSIRHEPGDVIFDGAYGVVVSVRREGVLVGRFAAVDGPIADV